MLFTVDLEVIDFILAAAIVFVSVSFAVLFYMILPVAGIRS